MLGGMKAAAEYEHLLGEPGQATAGMDALSIAHVSSFCSSSSQT
jgi:hypothetical protein